MQRSVFTCFLSLSFFCLSAATEPDSITKMLSSIAVDSQKVNALNDLSDHLESVGNFEGSLHYADQALLLSQKIKFKKGKASAYFNLGYAFKDLGNYAGALKNFKLSLNLRQSLQDKAGIASAYNGIGNVYDIKGNYPEALKNYFETLKIYEALGNKQKIAGTYNNIGNVYWGQHNYEEALKKHFLALEIRKSLNDQQGMCTSYYNIGIIYFDQKEYEKALENALIALKITEGSGDKKSLADIYNFIGNIHSKQNNYVEALKDQLSALKLKEEIGYKLGIASSYIGIAEIYSNLKDKAAIDYFNKALALSKELGAKQQIRDTYSSLVRLDSMNSDWKSAFEDHKMYTLYRDSLYNEEFTKKTVQAQMQFEFEKKQIEEEAEAKRTEEEKEANEKRLKYVQLMGIGAFMIVFISALLLLSRRKINSKVIDVMGTFSVLITFELLVVLLHPSIEEVVHHDFLLTLICMVGIASIIVPLHHRAEHWLKHKIGHKAVLITSDGKTINVNDEVIEEINQAKEDAAEEMIRKEEEK